MRGILLRPHPLHQTKKKLFENKLAVYNDLLLKSDKDLWKADLTKFLEIYKVKNPCQNTF